MPSAIHIPVDRRPGFALFLPLCWWLGFGLALKGNPARIRDCPAAVSENQIRFMHWSCWAICPAALGSDGK